MTVGASGVGQEFVIVSVVKMRPISLLDSMYLVHERMLTMSTPPTHAYYVSQEIEPREKETETESTTGWW